MCRRTKRATLGDRDQVLELAEVHDARE
jgi:hypothetical protein